MAYVRPENVKSPKAHWYLFEVVLDRGPGDCAYALGEWDGQRRLAFRWNGDDDNPLGNPQSRGIPIWIILDEALHEAVISMLSPENQETARRFFGIKR